MKKLDLATAIIIIIGSLNLGMMGIFDIDVFDVLFEKRWADRFVYALVGFSALYQIVYWSAIKNRKEQ